MEGESRMASGTFEFGGLYFEVLGRYYPKVKGQYNQPAYAPAFECEQIQLAGVPGADFREFFELLYDVQQHSLVDLLEQDLATKLSR